MGNKLIIKDGLVNNRESPVIEFKKSFSKNFKSYIKTISAFANNKGGKIIFGVSDRPRNPLGLFDEKLKDFREFDGKDSETDLQNYLSETVIHKFYEFSQKIDDKELIFGVLEIEESNNKPVICKKSCSNKPILREGAIYYRYNSKSEEIKSIDLIRMIQEEKNKERDLWVKNISQMAQVGIKNAGVFSYKGEMYAGQNKILLNKEILKDIKFIREGEFVEKEGADALILRGSIDNIEGVKVVETDPRSSYPYEGMTGVLSELKRRGIKDKLDIESRSKPMSIKHVFHKFKQKNNVEDDSGLFWSCGESSVKVKRYNEEFITRLTDCINNQEKLKSVIN